MDESPSTTARSQGEASSPLLRVRAALGASSAEIELLCQPTSWEYIQLLYLANDEQSATLGSTGEDLLDAWLSAGDASTRMAEPFVMASTTHMLPEPGLVVGVLLGTLPLGLLARRKRRASEAAAGSGAQRRPGSSRAI